MEHYRPNGNLEQGYFCGRCGGISNMYATGHGEGNCTSNRELVQRLIAANARDRKPRFRLDTPLKGESDGIQ